MIGFNHLGRLGQLGNQMFQYAALKGIATNRNYSFIVPCYPDPVVDALGNHLRTEIFDAFELRDCSHGQFKPKLIFKNLDLNIVKHLWNNVLMMFL